MNEQDLYGGGPMTDPLTALLSMEVGAIHAITDTGAGPQTDFYILEEDRYIKKISLNAPEVRIRSGLIEQDGVSLVTVLILLDRNFDMLYETWFNWWPHGQHIRYLASQRKINLHIYDRQSKRRSLQINNGLAADFAGYVQRLEGAEQWSMRDFDAEREKLYARYAKPEDMWKALLPPA